MSTKPSFFSELRRRNVLRAGVLYIGAVWALAQGIAQLTPVVGAPEWVARWFLIAATIGFPFWLAFAWFYEFTPQGLKRESEIANDASIMRSTGRKLDKAIIAVLAIAVVLLLANTFVWKKGAGLQTSGADTVSTFADIPDKSIAVLPLANDSGDKDQQYFSDGLSEGLINALSQLAGLKVISRNSSFQFRDSHDDSRTIGEKLGVAHLLEGSVQRMGGAVRITATLVNAADSSTLWSQHYDRPYTDLFKLQDDITQQVADALKTKLLEGAVVHAQSDRPPSGNLAAYNAYLQGVFLARRNTEADMRQAIKYYEEAVHIDPDYALAYATLARAEGAMVAVFSVTSRAERESLVAKARAAAATALALQPDLARAHYANAFLLQVVDLDLVAAEAEFRRAAELAPQDAATVFSLGIVNASFGRLDEAAKFGRQAVAIDPMSSINYVYLARTLRAMHRYDEAEAMLRKALEINPTGEQTYCELAILHLLRGDSAGAIELAQWETGPFWRMFALTLAHYSHGDTAEADAGLKQMIAEYAETGAFQIATIYAQRRQPDRMFEWLDRGLAVRDPGVPTLRYQAFVSDYRTDPRFVALCDKLGLPATTAAKAMP